ncbi:MAG: hypothetical protein HRT90_02310 [Candidatus Margulisbacteria bacterium]|nr:hypothetical protein [Candidatus Margulisiibacteriota bacterium]
MHINLEIPKLDKMERDLSSLKRQLKELQKLKKPGSWLTYDDVSQRLSLARNKLIDLQKAGLLINQNPSGHPRFSEENVENLISGKIIQEMKSKRMRH